MTSSSAVLAPVEVQIGEKDVLKQLFTSIVETGKSTKFMLGKQLIRASNHIDPQRSQVHKHDLSDMLVCCYSGEPLQTRIGRPIETFEPLLGYFRGVWLSDRALPVTLPSGIANIVAIGGNGKLVGFALSRTTGNPTTLVEISGKETATGQALLVVVPFEREKLAIA